MNKKIRFAILLLPVSLLLLPMIGDAQGKLEDQIKFRQSGMMFMRWNMGRIKKQLANDAVQYKKQEVLAAARVIAAIAESNFESLFNEQTRNGRGWKPTRVKPAYFLEPDKVRELANAFREQAGELLRVASDGDAGQLKRQFQQTFESCKACHKRYRSK